MQMFAAFSSKDRNFLVQDRVNEHLTFSKPLSPIYRRLIMNTPNARAPLPPTELPPSLLPVASGPEKAASIMTSDRLYQLAALTAGAFLLATLL